MSALVVALAINATDYYISGIGGWAEPGTKAELQLVGESDVLTCPKDAENGKVVVIKNGVRYSVKGAKL